MDAFEIMRSWDIEAGLSPRTDDELLLDVPGSLTCRAFKGDWEEWLAALEKGDAAAILEGRSMWDLSPIGNNS